MQLKELQRVIVDTTVQEKAIARIRWTAACWRSSATRCVSAAKRAGISLKQTFAKEGKSLCV